MSINTYADTKGIYSFLARFHECRDVDDVFTCGCCYWFANILCQRFPNAIMMYDPIANHFAASIDGQLYDITGCVNEKYKMEPWEKFDDELEKERIIRDCVMF